MNLQQFMADQHFQVSSLTAAINEAQSAPTLLASLQLFAESGINTTTFQLEYDGEVLSLVMPGERGESVQGQRKAKRKKITLSTVHLPVPLNIKADEITNTRAFGTQSEVESIQMVVNKHLLHARNRLVATRELMRAGAITGKVLDGNGDELVNLDAVFGITNTPVEYTPATKNAKALLTAAKTLARKKLGQATVQRWMLMCGPAFFDAYSQADDVTKGLQNKNGNSNDLVNDMTDGLSFHNVTAFAYDASVIGANGTEVPFIPTDMAYLIPMAPGLLMGHNAPADYVETVGTLGLPFYAKTELADLGKGIRGEAQSNPFYFCTRPEAIRRFVLA
ncbi:major capsid protein [Arsukibacterium indicum]|uniref:Major capsid protein n=1 Tax=Arsukibacterium indicum TaxID=2848612 RepID=A0ABS6MGI1_9GAMM|nr:major capsid protein [Arsukibacterium indicum]MBV2127926.1 major capsid protein [Arsukibacterium indicum]